MLTALSVARDCFIVGHAERVALVSVLPPADALPARMEFSFDADRNDTKVCVTLIILPDRTLVGEASFWLKA